MNRMTLLLSLLVAPSAFAQEASEGADASEDEPTVSGEAPAEEAEKPAGSTDLAAKPTADGTAPAEKPSATPPLPAEKPTAAGPVPEKPGAVPTESVAAAPVKEEKPKTEVKISGLYTIWGLTQTNFLFGKQVDGEDHPLDDTGYTVQMLRAKLELNRPSYGVVARMDIGQGWWGANNNPNVTEVAGEDAEGNPTTSTDYNTDKLFGNKDTNFAIHFDHVYGWADLELGGLPVHLQAGRQYFGVGHKLILDQDYDGVQIHLRPSDKLTAELWWAKVSEGKDAFKFPKGLLMSDDGAYADADLFGLKANGTFGDHKAEVYGLFYLDRSDQDDWSMFPSGVGYLRSRFAPNVSQAVAVGFAADGTLGIAEGLEYQVEGALLTGKDNVGNRDHAGGMLDINDGDLIGGTAYVDLKQKIDAGVPLDIGVTFGIGSGDADKTSGKGNLTKIQTMGFFPFTNVWEDSVMPDVEGISPQGLGSPVSRGYREFENTTAIRGLVGVQAFKPLRLEASYTYLMATTPIQGFDGSGVPIGGTASDIGMEVDGNVIIKFSNGVLYKGLFGYFIPGTAGAYLINGNDTTMDPAWELKNVLVVKF